MAEIGMDDVVLVMSGTQVWYIFSRSVRFGSKRFCTKMATGGHAKSSKTIGF